mgnify:CR=1 FL=1
MSSNLPKCFLTVFILLKKNEFENYKYLLEYQQKIFIIFTPMVLVFGAGNIIPDCNTIIDGNGGFVDPCNFDKLLILVNNFISYFIFII